jgi:hypothetical protein
MHAPCSYVRQDSERRYARAGTNRWATWQTGRGERLVGHHHRESWDTRETHANGESFTSVNPSVRHVGFGESVSAFAVTCL